MAGEAARARMQQHTEAREPLYRVYPFCATVEQAEKQFWADVFEWFRHMPPPPDDLPEQEFDQADFIDQAEEARRVTCRRETKMEIMPHTKRQPSKSCNACVEGVRFPATPACRIKMPAGWQVIECCDACGKHVSDLSAAEALAAVGQITDYRIVRCDNNGPHVIGVKASKHG